MVEESKFKCPLCSSSLTESRYYEIVGVWEEKKKFEKELKQKIESVKKEQEKLIKEKEEIKKKFEIEKKTAIEKAIKTAELTAQKNAQKELLAIKKANLEVLMKQKREYLELRKKDLEAGKIKEKEFLALKKEKEDIIKQKKKEILEATKKAHDEGVEKQKKRFEQVNKILEKKVSEISIKDKQIKELQEQLKKGSTPQLEGIILEVELVKELKNKFPHDKIEHHGKGGDIHHYVVCEGKEIALIVYECKKTQKFNKSYITQIKNDVIKNNANYGVLVTLACDKKQSQFWVEKDILIVHPFGAPYIAEVLRKSLIQLYSLKLSDKELGERAKKLLEYIKSNKFRNSVKDNIVRAKELYELLNKEVEYHKTLWEKRHEHYNAIAQQSKKIEEDSKQIVGEDLGEEDLEQPLVELKPRKKKKQEIYN